MLRLNPEQLSCLHDEIQCLWDGLPGRYLNLASGGGRGVGGLENSTKAGKKWNDHIDLHFGGNVTKGDCNCNRCLGGKQVSKDTCKTAGDRKAVTTLFSGHVQSVGLPAAHAVHVHISHRGKTGSNQTFLFMSDFAKWLLALRRLQE